MQGEESIKIVESLEGGNKKRKKDCSKGKREGQKKERKIVQNVKGRDKKKGKKDGEWFEREKKGRRKNKREKRKTVQWLEMKKQKKDALERTSLNGYDE